LGPLFLQMEGQLGEMGLHENPLVPNKKLRQIYVAMAEARELDEHVARLQRRAKGRRRLDSTLGQEACRVSTTIDLMPGDLVSDSQVGVVMNLLTGEKVDSLLKRVAEFQSGKRAKVTKAVGASRRVLPWIEDAGERLRMALGTALSFKTLGMTNVVVAYVRQGAIAKGTWRQVLGLASKLELPVIFVVLPAAKAARGVRVTKLSDKARRYGVPVIPVDLGDAVALYRVAQESMGRTRGGDGPVLIECTEFRLEGKGGRAPVDPLAQMGGFLLGRKVCTKAWLEGASDGLRRRIAVAG
jgi:TPP-dependent pyruvate/acetoin dehydrogenase alpha subunit